MLPVWRQGLKHPGHSGLFTGLNDVLLEGFHLFQSTSNIRRGRRGAGRLEVPRRCGVRAGGLVQWNAVTCRSAAYSRGGLWTLPAWQGGSGDAALRWGSRACVCSVTSWSGVACSAPSCVLLWGRGRWGCSLCTRLICRGAGHCLPKLRAWGGGNRSGGRQGAVALATPLCSLGPPLGDIRAGPGQDPGGWKATSANARAVRVADTWLVAELRVTRLLHVCHASWRDGWMVHPAIPPRMAVECLALCLIVVQWCGGSAARPGGGDGPPGKKEGRGGCRGVPCCRLDHWQRPWFPWAPTPDANRAGAGAHPVLSGGIPRVGLPQRRP